MLHAANNLRAVIALLATVAVALPASAQDDEGYFEPAARQIRMAVQGQRDGSHLQRLFGLRRLSDPTLDTLYQQLIRHREWQVQVHAILGLAENSESRQIDTWLLRQLKPDAQDAAIATALDLEMMPESAIRELLQWDGLQPMSKLLLIAELWLSNSQLPTELLQPLTEHPDLRIAGLACALLKQAGDAQLFDGYAERIARLSRRGRHDIYSWLFEVARQYELTSLGDWIIGVLADTGENLGERVRHSALYSALELAPPEAEMPMKREFAREMRYSARVRLMQMLLTTHPAEPVWAYDALDEDNEAVLHAMREVGIAQVNQSDEVRAIKALIDLDHPRSIQWAIEYATKRLTDPQAIDVFEHILDRSTTSENVPPGLVVAAAIELYKRNTEPVLTRLLAAEDDSAQQELLLLAMLDVHDEPASAAAGKLRRIGAGRADALALLLIASGPGKLDEADMNRLGLIAAGGGRVAESLQAQAAWLYLKRTNQIEPALARAFD